MAGSTGLARALPMPRANSQSGTTVLMVGHRNTARVPSRKGSQIGHRGIDPIDV